MAFIKIYTGLKEVRKLFVFNNTQPDFTKVQQKIAYDVNQTTTKRQRLTINCILPVGLHSISGFHVSLHDITLVCFI